MDFRWTEGQAAYLDSVARFASEHLRETGDLTQRDSANEFWWAGWKRLAEFGLAGLPAPVSFGGQAATRLTITGALEELGYACRDNGLLFGLNAHLWGCVTPVLAFGTQQQKERYLPGLCAGSMIGGLAMTEHGSGSDAYNLSMTAEPRDGGYVLNGHKVYVTNAPIADVLVVIARTGPGNGLGALSAFLIDRGTEGLIVGPVVEKMGLRTVPMGEVTLNDCWVPAEALLGAAGAGLTVFNVAMDWERSCILASAVGTMRYLLDRCIAHARERERFGKAIGQFQAVSHKIVEMKLRLETSRLIQRQLAWSLDDCRQHPAASALAKLHLSEALVRSSLDALQIHGAAGYLTETGLERQVRDAIAARLYSGTSEVQRNIIAGSLGL